MDFLTVLVPTRGRPESCLRLQNAFKELCRGRTNLFFIVDTDDESDYSVIENVIRVEPGPRGFVHPINQGFRRFSELYNPDYIGFMGDDHLPRTEGWDLMVMEELRRLRTGFMYGNDLFQGPFLPTAVFMTINIPLTLGFIAPPILRHLWVDNFWLDMGRALGKIKYIGGCVIEHLHPIAGNKSEWDETYEMANNPNAEHDKIMYQAYKASSFNDDLEKLKRLL